MTFSRPVSTASKASFTDGTNCMLMRCMNVSLQEHDNAQYERVLMHTSTCTCRPSGLAKKLQSRLVVQAIGQSHLMNVLNISQKTSKSIIDAYFQNKAIRYDRNEMDACE